MRHGVIRSLALQGKYFPLNRHQNGGTLRAERPFYSSASLREEAVIKQIS